MNPPIIKYYILKLQPEQPIVPVPVKIETITKEFICPICPECFELEEELKDHIKVHEENDKYFMKLDSEESCDEVDPLKQEPTLTIVENEVYNQLEIKREEAFIPSEQYDQHNITDNYSDESSDSNDNKSKVSSDFEPSEDDIKSNASSDYEPVCDKAKHFCPVCKKGFPSKPTVQNHILTHDLPDEDKLKYINKFKDIRTIPCPDCNTLFRTERDVKMHSRKHSLNKKLYCKSCNIYLASEERLKKHQLKHLNQLKCKICDKGFLNAKHLLIHEENHSKEKTRTKCMVCEKMILDEYFPTHIQLHNGEKPFPCKFCGKTFSLSKNLTQHLRVHTKEQPYKCNVCGKKFSAGSNLIVHLKRHEKNGPILQNSKKKITKEPEEELEEKIQNKKDEVFDCKSCCQKFNGSKGLKIHVTKAHKDDVEENKSNT